MTTKITPAICPHCLTQYMVGITGTVTGCDVCEEVIRDADGMIIPVSEWDAVTTEDELTDMEKA